MIQTVAIWITINENTQDRLSFIQFIQNFRIGFFPFVFNTSQTDYNNRYNSKIRLPGAIIFLETLCNNIKCLGKTIVFNNENGT